MNWSIDHESILALSTDWYGIILNCVDGCNLDRGERNTLYLLGSEVYITYVA